MTVTSNLTTVNPESCHQTPVHIPAVVPSTRRKVVPQLAISDHLNRRLTRSFVRLAENRRQRFGSLRERIAEVAPFANDYDDTEEPADE